MKRIRLTVEWDGARSEFDWADELRDLIEEYDDSGLTTVTDVECVTLEGTTEVRAIPILDRVALRAKRLIKREESNPFWIYVIAAAVILIAVHLGRSAA